VSGVKNQPKSAQSDVTERDNRSALSARQSRPLRRVYIPKPGKTEQRQLSIPTLLDRAWQTLVKLALEPEWEARFELNSYGSPVTGRQPSGPTSSAIPSRRRPDWIAWLTWSRFWQSPDPASCVQTALSVLQDVSLEPST